MNERLSGDLGRLEVVVCCGAGGVGKTTVSAALAMAIAARHDKRVLVLTVDPARRLATALGIDEIGSDPVLVPAARLRQLGARPKGELFAAMLDQKTAWDRMVERCAPSPEVAARIYKNQFYKGVSGAFVGSHEFMAMEELFELHAAGEYDCIVVDTPPSRNALDFLEAPDRAADFVGAKLLSWLAGGSRFGFRALNLAARPLMSMADRLVGSDVLDDLAAFIGDFEQLYVGVQRHAKEVYRLLRSPAVGFVVVTTLEPAAFGEAEFFASKLREFRMPLRAIVVNQALPDLLKSADAARVATTLSEDHKLPSWVSQRLGRSISADALHGLGDTFTIYHKLAVRNARQLAGLSRIGGVPVATVPLLTDDVTGLAGLIRIGSSL